MACGSSCCGPSTSASPHQRSTHEDQDIDKDIGLSELAGPAGEEDDTSRKDSKLPLAVSTPCQDACCGKPDESLKESTKCETEDAGPNDDCCTSNKDCSFLKETPAPSCCEGIKAPCCDQSCLDRLALRECENHDGPTTSSCALSGCNSGSNGKACAEHIRKTSQTYAAKLEALGCICRALIALGQESCCNSRRRSAAGDARRQPNKKMRPSSRASANSCCVASGAGANTCSTKMQAGSQEGCSSGDVTRINNKPWPVRMATSCAKPCCAEEEAPGSADSKPITPLIGVAVAQDADLEKGPAGDEKEHVILSISGMTCTGCETKLARTLGTHPSVRGLKTSLVLSRAEFDLVGPSSAAEVMKHVERTTEFKCEKVTNRGSRLDLVAAGSDAAAFASQPWPEGVTDVRVVDKKTVSVSFDAKVVGARDLVERGWGDGPVRLAPLRPDAGLEAGSRHVRHVGYMTLLSACLTIPVLVMAWAPLPERQIQYGSASLALATLVQFIIAGPFYPKALKALIFSRVIEMDLLVVLSTSAAYIFSVVSFGYMVSGQPLSTGEFFETSTLLVTLIMVGRWLSALARQKAVESVSIRSLQSRMACLVTENGETDIDACLLQYGDVFKVVPDSRIPTDGTVVSGSSEVDESMITGESRPIEKHARSPVIAGSVNGPGVLHVLLTRLPDDNTISTIASMVDEAKLSKPKIQDLADRIASYFVPVIIIIAIITFCIWTAIGVRARGQSGSEATIQAISYAITVLIVSCPCAIGLAVPMVIVIASGVAAERGVIWKSAECIESAYKTSHVVLDKTGTITNGKLSIVREWYAAGDQTATQSLLLGLVKSIKHPVSVAVVSHLEAQRVKPFPVSNVKTATGKGVEGTAKSSSLVLRAGNSRWLNLTSDAVVRSVSSQGYTAFCFTIDGSVVAIFGLQDTIRPDAAPTVKTLLDRGISVHIISGDDEGAVRSVADQLNIAETNVRSRCTPADKQAYIQDLLDGPPLTLINAKKAKKPVVIFCGDGTNDAVALAQASIGVHMNEGGTDVAQSAADIILMRPNLGGILTAIAISRKSTHRFIFNFGWCFVYNLFAILLASGGLVNVRIPPEYAGLGELVSVLPVIAAAILLRWSKI